MDEYIDYILPGIALFIAQAVLCLGCKNKHVRLIPTAIALAIAAYHTAILIASLDSMWVVGFAFGYIALTILPPLAGAGLGWAVYVVKLMIREFRAQPK